MKREINNLRKPIYESQAKEAKHKAEIKEKEAAHYDTALQKKDEYDDARIGATKAREKASLASAERARVAADRHADTMDRMRKRGYTGSYNTNSSKGSDYTSSAWSTKSDGSRWRGKPQKGDIKIQEYKNKDQWIISEADWKYNYARINEILAKKPNSAAAKALQNAKNETERMAVAQKYATSTKESYDYMRALSKGYIPGNKAYASKESKPAGKEKVDMGASRSEALNKLKGAKV